MTIIVCRQSTGRGAECPECGGGLHRRDVPEPVRLVDGPAVCSPDCAASYTERAARVDVDAHLHLRDLLCDCAQVCAPRGLPTAAMRAEYSAYAATRPPE